MVALVAYSCLGRQSLISCICGLGALPSNTITAVWISIFSCYSSGSNFSSFKACVNEASFLLTIALAVMFCILWSSFAFCLVHPPTHNVPIVEVWCDHASIEFPSGFCC